MWVVLFVIRRCQANTTALQPHEFVDLMRPIPLSNSFVEEQYSANGLTRMGVGCQTTTFTSSK